MCVTATENAIKAVAGTLAPPQQQQQQAGGASVLVESSKEKAATQPRSFWLSAFFFPQGMISDIMSYLLSYIVTILIIVIILTYMIHTGKFICTTGETLFLFYIPYKMY